MATFFVSIHLIACPFRAGPAEEKEFEISQFFCKFVPRPLLLACSSREGTQTFSRLSETGRFSGGAFQRGSTSLQVHPRLFLLSRWESKKFLKQAPK